MLCLVFWYDGKADQYKNVNRELDKVFRAFLFKFIFLIIKVSIFKMKNGELLWALGCNCEIHQIVNRTGQDDHFFTQFFALQKFGNFVGVYYVAELKLSWLFAERFKGIRSCVDCKWGLELHTSSSNISARRAMEAGEELSWRFQFPLCADDWFCDLRMHTHVDLKSCCIEFNVCLKPVLGWASLGLVLPCW